MVSVHSYLWSSVQVIVITSSVLEQKLPLIYFISKVLCVYIFFFIPFIIHSLERLLSIAYYLFSSVIIYSEMFPAKKMVAESLQVADIFFNVLCLSQVKKWYLKKIS